MNKKQFAIIATAIKAAYPNSKVMETEEEMEFWYKMLQDLESPVVENAVMEYMCTKKFPPTIAEIREMCIERMASPLLTADEAWGTVCNALSNYGFYNPQAAFETMDEITLSIVKNLGWSRLCQSENPVADRANFRMAYEEKAKHVQAKRMLPEFVEQKKLELQAKYIQVIEEKPKPAIEQKEEIEDIRENLTPEQIERREQMFEEVRRRLMNGKTDGS